MWCEKTGATGATGALAAQAPDIQRIFPAPIFPESADPAEKNRGNRGGPRYFLFRFPLPLVPLPAMSLSKVATAAERFWGTRWP